MDISRDSTTYATTDAAVAATMESGAPTDAVGAALNQGKCGKYHRFLFAPLHFG